MSVFALALLLFVSVSASATTHPVQPKEVTATRQVTAKGRSIDVLMRYKACALKLAIIVCSD